MFALAVAGSLVVAVPMGLSVLPALTQPTPSLAEADEELGAVPTPLPLLLHSKWLAQSAHPTIAVGEVATLWLAFRNTGPAAWIRDSAAEVRLGLEGKPEEIRRISTGLALEWLGADRPGRQDETYVSNGAQTRFTFKVKGAVPGRYRLELRPVVDGVDWLEDDGAYIDVTVR